MFNIQKVKGQPHSDIIMFSSLSVICPPLSKDSMFLPGNYSLESPTSPHQQVILTMSICLNALSLLLGEDDGIDPGLTGGVTNVIWPGNISGSPRRS